ncbi:2-oxoacid:ferredoxin oxidoreductase subunit beta [Bacteroidota bacterium]
MEEVVHSCTLTKADFNSDQEVKWCPGCGGHAVLSAIKSALVNHAVPIEKVVFVSGIGCSSRFPYYINTYGFHSLHGRAPAIASGIKLANPELSVWVATGDGDSMAIGGNHFIHILRRNIDVNIIIFNNKIYGLTKGQASPTTPKGIITKTSPYGNIENPFNPGELAMGAQGTFFARAIDTDLKMMTNVFTAAAKHKGTSVVEVLQNCVIFNDKIHNQITDKDLKDDNQIFLEHGKPMIFGTNRRKGLIRSGTKFIVVEIDQNGITEKDILIHDSRNPDETQHFMLARMTLPDHPVATGVIRDFSSTIYEDEMYKQIKEQTEKSTHKNVFQFFRSGNVFSID